MGVGSGPIDLQRLLAAQDAVASPPPGSRSGSRPLPSLEEFLASPAGHFIEGALSWHPASEAALDLLHAGIAFKNNDKEGFVGSLAGLLIPGLEMRVLNSIRRKARGPAALLTETSITPWWRESGAQQTGLSTEIERLLGR